jgi:toluene monooxygenase system ferredoxin subunit
MRVEIGRLDEIPTDSCVAIGDGRAVAVRVGGTVRAYRNRCLHQDAPLAGGWVRDGVLSCPLHFWRYNADTGQQIGRSISLDSFDVEIVDGVVIVDLPDEPPRMSLREQLLLRARNYDRESAWEHDVHGSDPP